MSLINIHIGLLQTWVPSSCFHNVLSCLIPASNKAWRWLLFANFSDSIVHPQLYKSLQVFKVVEIEKKISHGDGNQKWDEGSCVMQCLRASVGKLFIRTGYLNIASTQTTGDGNIRWAEQFGIANSATRSFVSHCDKHMIIASWVKQFRYWSITKVVSSRIDLSYYFVLPSFLCSSHLARHKEKDEFPWLYM